MLSSPVSQNLINKQLQVQAQGYLEQARLQKTMQQLEMSLASYNQAKVIFRQIAEAQSIFSLSELKGALSQALKSQTSEEEALRKRIAEIYTERGELLDRLGKSDKAQASYRKAKAWGYEGSLPILSAPLESLRQRVTDIYTEGEDLLDRLGKSDKARTGFRKAKAWIEQKSSPTSNASLTEQKVSTQPVISTPTPVQQPPVFSSAQDKNILINYLFEKALSTLSSLEVSNKPSLFLVYAHDNDQHGKAHASISKYLISKLSQIRVNLYSDQAPKGEPYASSLEDSRDDGKIEDIVTNQLCLLPESLRADVKPVDKVVVCCSEVLGSYLQWTDYEKFYQELHAAYLQDRETYRRERVQSQSSAVSIRQVVRKFSLDPEYKDGFHHVLTEIAFLQIRKAQLQDQHGIIPIALTPNSYDQCLSHFIPVTTVRMEDIPRYEQQANEVRHNQSRHWVLFKLIERVLVGSDEARTFLNKFWQGYSDCLSRLDKGSTFDELAFVKLVDSIFDGIRTALHSQLAFTVQQQHQQLRLLNADPKVTLKAQYDAALTQDQVFAETLRLYVEPRSKVADETIALFTQVHAFLQSDKQVLLLTGDSGAGKSTFNQLLEKKLWESRKEADPVPLFISLPSIDKPEHDLIAKALHKRGLSELQIQKLKKEKQKLIFILDGYDEIQQTRNLYLSNQINQPDNWLGQMVISCRSEYLGQRYQSRFQPNPHLQEKDTFFEEVEIEPFSSEERDAYLDKYVTHRPTGWTVQQYQEALEQPHVKDLVRNPFLLRVTLEALPHLAIEGKARTTIQLRLDLYNQFLRQWFERNEQRLGGHNLTEAKRENFRVLCDEGFAEHGIAFTQDLAIHLYTEQVGNPVVEYLSHKNKGSWKETFFSREEEKQILREAWPLIRSGSQYRFIHKSLLEYLVARALFDSFDAFTAPARRSRRGSDASVYSFDNAHALVRPAQPTLPLAPKHWCHDLGVVSLLIERVQQEPAFKEQLLAIIEQSKTDKAVRLTAANAITVLARAGVPFSGIDFTGIQIPGANLSYGIFDSVQLSGTDLRKVNLTGAWLRNADLRGAHMGGVQFGELPELQFEDVVSACCYSPDGQLLIVAHNDIVTLHDTKTLEEKGCLIGHKNQVSSVVMSNDGRYVISGSIDKTVRVWDWQAPNAIPRILGGHKSSVNSVAISANGRYVVSGSGDKTVRVWDWQKSNARPCVLRGHESSVISVAISADGRYVVSGSEDATARVWDWQMPNAAPCVLGGDEYLVNNVAISADGRYVVSSSYENTMWVWDWQIPDAAPRALGEHESEVSSIVMSADGRYVISGSEDNTVRVWDWQTPNAVPRVLSGHQASVNSVAMSADSRYVASGSADNTVRVWDWHTLDTTPRALSGHQGAVNSVETSTDGRYLVSGSSDKTVEVWDWQALDAVPRVFSGHDHSVLSVTMSADGRIVVSGSFSGDDDGTVQVWDWQRSDASPLILSGHESSVFAVAISADGQYVVSGSGDGKVQVWNWQTRNAKPRVFHGDESSINSVAMSADGRYVISGSNDNTVRVWDWQTPSAEPQVLNGHEDSVKSVAMSASNRHVVSGSDDKTVRVWDIASGQCLAKIRGFNGEVNSVAWRNINGIDYLITGSEDKAVRCWQLIPANDQWQAKLWWAPSQDTLTLHGAKIEGVKGLSPMNSLLLKQRGAKE